MNQQTISTPNKNKNMPFGSLFFRQEKETNETTKKEKKHKTKPVAYQKKVLNILLYTSTYHGLFIIFDVVGPVSVGSLALLCLSYVCVYRLG